MQVDNGGGGGDGGSSSLPQYKQAQQQRVGVVGDESLRVMGGGEQSGR